MDRGHYERLIRSVDIQTIALVNLEYERDIHLHPERQTLQVNRTFDVKLISFDHEKIESVGVFNLMASAVDADERAVRIDMTWLVRYKLSSASDGPVEVDEELAQAFVRNNVPINLWPYIREMVQNLTYRSGLTPLLLPTLKIIR